jgi:hypothetical protein
MPQGQQTAPVTENRKRRILLLSITRPVVMEIDSPDGCQGVVLVVDDLVGR